VHKRLVGSQVQPEAAAAVPILHQIFDEFALAVPGQHNDFWNARPDYVGHAEVHEPTCASVRHHGLADVGGQLTRAFASPPRGGLPVRYASAGRTGSGTVT